MQNNNSNGIMGGKLNSNIRCIEMKKWSLEEKCEFVE